MLGWRKRGGEEVETGFPGQHNLKKVGWRGGEKTQPGAGEQLWGCGKEQRGCSFRRGEGSKGESRALARGCLGKEG